jgi:hypothetical protein
MNRLILLLFLVQSIQIQADDSVLKKENLKILALGNSYTDDYFYHLKDITTASGSDVSDMCIYKISRSYASFKAWCDMYNDKDIYDYYFTKVLGGYWPGINQATGQAGDGTVLRDVLTNVQWDLILIQPSSPEAPYHDSWESNGYLDELINILHDKQPNAEIGIVLVHSYWDDYSMNDQKSSYTRWQMISESVQWLTNNYDINLVVPCGTALENLRMSSQNNDYDLTRDGTHLAYGLGRYVASGCCYEALIAPRSGISLKGNTMRYSVPETFTSKYPAIDVTDVNAPVAQEAIQEAILDPYTCNNPDEADMADEETITISNLNDGYGYCTYSSLYDLDFNEVSGEDLKAYIVAGYDYTKGVLTAMAIKNAPGGTGLLIKGKAGTHQISRNPSTNYYVNMLVAVPESAWVPQTDGLFTNFILGYKDGKIGFYSLSADGYIGPNKAYLQIPSSLLTTAQGNYINIAFDDEEEVDGIKEAITHETDDIYYTLSGVKVSLPQKGLFIKQGRKVVVR